MLVQACYISLAAILGTLTRMILAQLFGEECANPGTVGWLSAGSPLCVTKDGQTQQPGGIVFADLPANILGSFLMGFFQDYAVLGLAVPMAVAWLPPTASFQRCAILHTAFKTGFCGSLTTFSSWNSEMIVLTFGTGSTQTTRIVSALLGYIIGMETALGSFTCGCSFARRLHRAVNPTLAAEGDAMHLKREEGIYINHSLPDFERRYLHKLDMGVQYTNDLYPIADDRIASLERWRKSTEHIRRVNHPMIEKLKEIENLALVNDKPISKEVDSVARLEHWDIDSLNDWVNAKSTDIHSLPSVSSAGQGTKASTKSAAYSSFLFGSASNVSSGVNMLISPGYGSSVLKKSKWLKLPVASLLVTGVLTFLLISLLTLRTDNAIAVTDRTMVYAMMFAPIGALLRWHFSQYNGGGGGLHVLKYLGGAGSWFPYGTFYANVIGCVVSIVTVALEYKFEQRGVNAFWTIGTLRAIRVGFAGSLTTVSTFVAEVSNFMRTKTDHAYPYIITSLGTCGIIGTVIYGCIVYL
jgi:fluoride exporter